MNDISELRSHLFETLRGLKDKDAPMDIDRARAVSEVAKTLIETVKVEVDYLRITGGTEGTGFISIDDNGTGTITDKARGTETTVSLLEGARVTRHIAK